MVIIEDKFYPDGVCNSCLDREAGAYALKVGSVSTHHTTLALCSNCVNKLIKSAQEVMKGRE